MSIIVQKYGGSSVADAERVFRVANRIVERYKEGNKVVVVVSAQGDTTDDLIEKAYEINENPSKREMDMLLATGEQISCSLLAMAIQKLQCPVISLTGYQYGMSTDSNYGNARIKKVNPERINAELERGNIVICAGFQGINKYDDITTLGRGGSDTTAVAIAVAINADVCEIYTDVEGIYTTDPRIVPEAKKLDEISYDELLELASLGANVMHNRSVEMAKKYNMNLCIRSSFTKAEGTIVKEVKDVESMLVRGVTRDNDVARISVVGVENAPGKAFEVLSIIAKKGISVDLILQSRNRANKEDISFTVAKKDVKEAIDALNANQGKINAEQIESDENVCKVSIVGAGMVNNPGVAVKMFEALYNANINIQAIATSEIKVSVLVDAGCGEKAVAAIHEKFDLGK